MKVYVVHSGADYDVDNVLDIFLHLPTAIKFVEEEITKYPVTNFKKVLPSDINYDNNDYEWVGGCCSYIKIVEWEVNEGT